MIGKGGTKLKSIGTGARKEIESLLGTRVYLELHVIVEENWRESRYFVDSLDWRKQLEDLAQAKPASRKILKPPLKPNRKANVKLDEKPVAKLDGCPRFAHLPRLAVGAYLGRKSGAKPHQCFNQIPKMVRAEDKNL